MGLKKFFLCAFMWLRSAVLSITSQTRLETSDHNRFIFAHFRFLARCYKKEWRCVSCPVVTICLLALISLTIVGQMGPFAGAHLSVNLVNSRDGLDNVRPIRSSSEAHAEAYCHLKSLSHNPESNYVV